MKKEKEFYASPEVEAFILQSEGVVCQSPGAKINDWEDDDDPLSF